MDVGPGLGAAIERALEAASGHRVRLTGEPVPLTGGFSAELYVISLADPIEPLGGELVLRIPRHGAGLLREAIVQREAARCGYPAPAVSVIVDDPENPLGRPFLVMAKAPGRPLFVDAGPIEILKAFRSVPVVLARAHGAAARPRSGAGRERARRRRGHRRPARRALPARGARRAVDATGAAELGSVAGVARGQPTRAAATRRVPRRPPRAGTSSMTRAGTPSSTGSSGRSATRRSTSPGPPSAEARHRSRCRAPSGRSCSGSADARRPASAPALRPTARWMRDASVLATRRSTPLPCCDGSSGSHGATGRTGARTPWTPTVPSLTRRARAA